LENAVTIPTDKPGDGSRPETHDGPRRARQSGVDKRRRLLDAAIELFARDGFEGASVREICTRARANVAAVKYYFGDKAGLYRASLDAAAEALLSDRPPPVPPADADPRTALRLMIRWAVEFTVAGGPRRVALTRIILRELREPTPVFEELLATRGAPMLAEVREIVLALAKGSLSMPAAERLALCVIVCATQYEHSIELLTRLGYPPPKTAEELDLLAEVISGMAIAYVDARRGGDA
jgi:AcrR family transcriptional regulator